MATRRNDPIGTRAKIVDVAFDAFARAGYEAVPLQDLRARAAVSGGAFAHHFPSKRSLGIAVIRDRVARAVEDAWIAPVVSASDAPSGVLAACDAVICDLEAQAVIAGCPLNNLAIELSARDEEMRVELDAIFERWRSVVAGKLRIDQAAGRTSDLDPEALATFAVSALSGAITMCKASQTATALGACRQALARMFAGLYRPAVSHVVSERTGRRAARSGRGN